MFPIYKNSKKALKETDKFYLLKSGFSYDIDYVVSWLKNNIGIPEGNAKILDLCCGDGIWSYGFKKINPKLELYGCDISTGGIKKANELMGSSNFIVCDAEKSLPFDENFFDLIFCRGPGLYNQHSFNTKAAKKIITNWHSLLKKDGLFYSIFASNQSKFNTYTDMKDSVLPYNRSPRKSKAVNFKGGKFHHSIQSFTKPFLEIGEIDILEYKFSKNLHTLITVRKNDFK